MILIKLAVVQYMFGIQSMRQTVQEIKVNNAYRWFLGLSLHDTEHKRKAIAAATPQDNPLYSKLNSARYTVTDEETLKRLIGLK